MQILFYIAALSGLAYIAFARRRFDLASIAYLSALVYFLPGFFGEVIYPIEGESVIVWSPLVDDAYLVMLAVLLGLLITAVLIDQRASRPAAAPGHSRFRYAAEIATALALLGMLMTVLGAGFEALDSPDKSVVIEEYTRWSIFWDVGATLAAVFAFQRRKMVLLAVSYALLVGILYIGFRNALALALISTFCVWLHEKGPVRLAISQWRAVLLGVLGAGALFVYKFLFEAIKRGDYEYVWSLLADPEFYVATVLHSEPFLVQSTLNEVIGRQFTFDLGHFSSVLYSFLMFAPELGVHIVGFNDLMQPQLFPYVSESGLAGNIWAEMIASGGWLLLSGFLLFFLWTVAWGNRFLLLGDPELKGGAAVVFCYWVFYIHRNEILVQITIEKRAVIVLVLCLALSWLFSQLTASPGSRSGMRPVR